MDYTEPPKLNQPAMVVKLCQRQYKRQPEKLQTPRISLWVWRYDADMRWIDSTKYGIAYLAGLIKIGKKRIVKFPRFNSLKVPNNCYIEAVVRLEMEPGFQAEQKEIEEINRLIVSLLPKDKKIDALQIDFDATRSQRPFYLNLMKELRNKCIERSLPLNMTALSSWSSFDNWVGDMPVENIVPMFFRMGKEREKMLSLIKNNQLKKSRCIGIAVDEPDVLKALTRNNSLKNHQRIYLFSPGGWNSSQSRDFAKEVLKHF